MGIGVVGVVGVVLGGVGVVIGCGVVVGFYFRAALLLVFCVRCSLDVLCGVVLSCN